MVKPVLRMIASEISHMPLHFVWRESGVTEKHGFKLEVHVCNSDKPDQPFLKMEDRAPKLLAGEYDFISGLHHEPYVYRAKGDKRFIYIAQAQNDWDDRIIATQEIRSAKDLEGKKMIVHSRAPCVYGNLRHSLQVGGADLNKIEWVLMPKPGRDICHEIVEAVAKGEAAAAGVDAPFDLQGEKRGLHKLDVPSIPVIHNTTLCANQEWVNQNEESAMAFLRSMVDAIHFFKTEKSKVCDILERHMAPLINLEGPDEVEHLQRVWADLLSPKPYPHPLAVWNVYDLDVGHNPEINFINPFEIWNTSYLRAIDDSQYIDELYGGAERAVNPAVNITI